MVRMVSSADCGAMRRKTHALERRRVALTLDLESVGRDMWQTNYETEASSIYTLTVRTRDGAMQLRGNEFAMEHLVGPILRAADACLTQPTVRNTR